MEAADIESFRKKIIVVYSPGGGTGKSEIAANLACCLAQRGLRTWILDTNTFAPAQDIIFGFPPGRKTFSDFLLGTLDSAIPCYDISDLLESGDAGYLFLTPCNRADPDIRFSLYEHLASNTIPYGNIPAALFQGMRINEIDLLIIDTFSSFEPINEVWLSLTECLMVISRINDIDLENLKLMLSDDHIIDIEHKLLIFSNVQLDEERRALADVDNHVMSRQIEDGQSRASLAEYLIQAPMISGLRGAGIEIYERAFLYSEALATFGYGNNRKGLFVQQKHNDQFSATIEHLADTILRRIGR